MSNNGQSNIIIIDETNFNESLDIVIKSDTLENMINDIKSYGLTFQKCKRPIKFNSYKKQEPKSN